MQISVIEAQLRLVGITGFEMTEPMLTLPLIL